MEEGRRFAVDLDLKKFFDLVNHDVLMERISREVSDKRLLRLIRKYLGAGVLDGEIVKPSSIGTPQGGPLSPLLANIILDDFDKLLENRGHKFARYADDVIILVRSLRAGERVKTKVTQYLRKRLKLVVNEEKTKVVPTNKAKFLGFEFHSPTPEIDCWIRRRIRMCYWKQWH